MVGQAAARVDDTFGHSSAMSGVMIGLAIGAIVGAAILTGGVSLIAVGAAVAITGGAGLAGEAIGQTMDGPDTGVIEVGSPTVFINGRPAAMTVLATGTCSQDSGPPVKVATGAMTVLINGQPAGRVGEKMDCSAVIRSGSNNVFIGGPSKQVIKPTPEVPDWLNNTMTAMVIGGTAIGTLGIGLAYGVGAAVGSLVGGVGGSYFGGKGATALAAAMGYGATGQAVAGVVGGFAGGAIGGGLGFRGGQAAGNRIWSDPTTPTGVMLRQGTSGGDPTAVASVNRALSGTDPATASAVRGMPADFQSEYAQAKAAGWQKPDGKTWWPPNDGAAGAPVRTYLEPPASVDRFGNSDGSYLGKPGDSFAARGLPGEPTGEFHSYQVEKPTLVDQADIAPWFDQPGGGTQYKLADPYGRTTSEGLPRKYSVDDAMDDGFFSETP